MFDKNSFVHASFPADAEEVFFAMLLTSTLAFVLN